jgi:hypothetical protein
MNLRHRPSFRIEVRPDRSGPPIDSDHGRRVTGQLAVHVFFFVVTDRSDPASILEIRNLAVRRDVAG